MAQHQALPRGLNFPPPKLHPSTPRKAPSSNNPSQA